ncbi:MAG: hypothetical protein HC830_03075 [Bacteroidetes bacterium]|nr:hypothetical protein [Bacteroidales bacterium]NJO68379.1 hypothetical protein [Bacteroidota bacterium]
MIGKDEFLRPVFRNSISVAVIKLAKNEKGAYSGILFVKNISGLTFDLKTSGTFKGLSLPDKITVPPASTVAVSFDYTNNTKGNAKIEFPVEVTNFLAGPNKAMNDNLLINFNIE